LRIDGRNIAMKEAGVEKRVDYEEGMLDMKEVEKSDVKCIDYK
jgi:hypothetical protein